VVLDTLTPFRGNPQTSVPVTGTAVAGFQVSYQPLPGTVDSMRNIPNPTPISPASLENGRKYYQINCAVCHGIDGAANTIVKSTYFLPVPSLLTDLAKSYPDGYIFGMIRNGRGLMPTYNRIEEMDRWDVVNYVRALQGRAGAPADTTRIGYPGQNGATVPGPTELAPTRPSPWYGPNSNLKVGTSPMTNAATPAPSDSAAATTGARRQP
jgi:mono/diheme cytochrome c family protein